MAANTAPIYGRTPQTEWNATAITAANTAKDGTGTVVTCFTADATEGSFLARIRVRPLGTNVATVMRVFLNNGLTNATPANNTLLTEITIAASTVIETAALPEYEVPMNLQMQAGHKINIVIGTAVAAGFAVTGIGLKY